MNYFVPTKHLIEHLSAFPPLLPEKILIDQAIELYVHSGCYEDANRLGKFLYERTGAMSAQQKNRLIALTKQNSQVMGSFLWPTLKRALEARSGA